MSTLLPILTLDQPCDHVLAWVNEQLSMAGFRVVETFDLKVARLAHNDCPCPYHGTEGCTCQMNVLLIYQNKQEYPSTLVIHGQETHTWLSLVAGEEPRVNHKLETTLRRVLLSIPTHTPDSVEVTDQADSN